MRLLKHSSLLLCGLTLILMGANAAEAQKKDGSSPSIPTPVPTTPYSNVKRDSLLNGLQLVSLERSDSPVVKCDLVIRGGAMFDLAGKTGIARLTQETLLGVNPNLREELDSLQGKIDWGVNWDTTWFHIEMPVNNFEPVMEIVARLLVVENIRPEAFKSAMQGAVEKVKSQQLSPAERAEWAFLKALYGDHPYGHSIDGDEATLAGVKQGDIYDFMRRFYIANNASVVVSGNILHERIMKAFKVFFGGWTKGQIVPATFRPPTRINQLQLVKVEVPDSPKIEIRGGVLGVKQTDQDFVTAQVVSAILSARLKKDQENSSGEIDVKLAPRVLPGPFFYSASVATDQAPALSRRLTEAFAGLSTTPISPEELAAAKGILASLYSAQSVESFLREIEVYSLPRNHPTTIISRIEKVSGTDVQRVAKKLIEANALTVVVLGRVNESFKSNL